MNATKAQLIGGTDQHVSALLAELASRSYHRSVDPSELLHHFVQTIEPLWMGSSTCQSLLQQHAPRLALQSPFLLHTILAFSAYHIAALFPAQQHHETVGDLHYSHALQSYGKALDDESVDPDALFACCMLLTLLSFKHLSDDTGNSDTVGGKENFVLDTLGIRFIKGPRVLSDAFARRSTLNEGIWKPLILHCGEFSVEEDMLASCPGASQSMAGLEALCRGDEMNSPYRTALTSLRLLMQYYVYSKQQNMVEFSFCFAIQLDPRFLPLVEKSAPEALLMLCYWYALVAHVDQWWACRTAQIQGLKLLQYLRGTADLAVQALLDFPAQLLDAQSSSFQSPKIL
jgi:hypothetical protein